ncbi:D-glucuronyl C5-epimerase family protein [Microvirga sp. 2TAF3]|uniref:D-glucuronyl C5-epimerase family protein n=1 Tax=Microvirga sp. 2TAF3 TaxID=3233014 RepID=UPI003F9A39BE
MKIIVSSFVVLAVVGAVVGGVAVRSAVPRAGGAEHLPTVTTDVHPALGIPAVVHRPNNALLRPYQADRAGLTVVYEGDLFKDLISDMTFSPETLDGAVRLPWRTSVDGSPGLYGLSPGARLTLLDNDLHDLGVGSLMVRIRREDNGLEGYIPLSVILGESRPADDGLWLAQNKAAYRAETTVILDGIQVYAPQLPSDVKAIEQNIATLSDPSRYAETLSAGFGSVHPVFAGNMVNALLGHALRNDTTAEQKARIIDAARTFFANYVIPSGEHRGGGLAWAYHFPFVMNWGVSLKDPWYSSYASAVFANAGAILYRLTGEQQYRDLSLAAGRYVGMPITQGGAEYEVSGFRLPAEYVYDIPHNLNVRVLDGEMIALINLYNAARLLGDRSLLDIFTRQAFSLSMQLDYFTKADGQLYFAAYGDQLPEGYRWIVWSALQILGTLTKDRRFVDTAIRLHSHIPVGYCSNLPC